MRNAAVVIGVSRIALDIADRLVADGWPVVLFGAEGPELGAAEERMEGEDIRVAALDLSDAEDVDELFDQAVDATGPIGVLVICLPETDDDALEADALRRGFDGRVAASLTAIGAARERRGDQISVLLVGSEETASATVLNGTVTSLVEALADSGDEQLRINFLRAGAGSRDRQLADAAMLLAAPRADGISGQSILIGHRRRSRWSGL